MAAIQDDGVVTKEEKKQIKKIKKAIRAFSLSLKYEVRAHDVIRGLVQITDIGFAYTLRRDDGHFSGVGYDPSVKGTCYMNRHGDIKGVPGYVFKLYFFTEFVDDLIQNGMAAAQRYDRLCARVHAKDLLCVFPDVKTFRLLFSFPVWICFRGSDPVDPVNSYVILFMRPAHKIA